MYSVKHRGKTGITKAFNSDVFPQCFCCAKKSLAQQKHYYKTPVNAGVRCAFGFRVSFFPVVVQASSDAYF